MDDVIPMAGKNEELGISWRIEEVATNYFTVQIEFCDRFWPYDFMTASSLAKAQEMVDTGISVFKKNIAEIASHRIDAVLYDAERLIKCVHIGFIRDLLLKEHSNVCDEYEEPLRSKLAEIIEVILK